MEAAAQLFDEKGYSGATTREIAAHAGVAETMLFRAFGSKANLFAEAVLAPLAEFFRDWVDHTMSTGVDGGPEAAQYRFTSGLYEMFAAHRGQLLAFLATGVFEPELTATDKAAASIQEALDDLAAAGYTALVGLGVDLTDYDVRITSRAVIGMILAVALFDKLLLPTGPDSTPKDLLLEQLTRQILYGTLNQRPEGARKPRSRTTARPNASHHGGARRD